MGGLSPAGSVTLVILDGPQIWCLSDFIFILSFYVCYWYESLLALCPEYCIIKNGKFYHSKPEPGEAAHEIDEQVYLDAQQYPCQFQRILLEKQEADCTKICVA